VAQIDSGTSSECTVKGRSNSVAPWYDLAVLSDGEVRGASVTVWPQMKLEVTGYVDEISAWLAP